MLFRIIFFLLRKFALSQKVMSKFLFCVTMLDTSMKFVLMLNRCHALITGANFCYPEVNSPIGEIVGWILCCSLKHLISEWTLLWGCIEITCMFQMQILTKTHSGETGINFLVVHVMSSYFFNTWYLNEIGHEVTCVGTSFHFLRFDSIELLRSR